MWRGGRIDARLQLDRAEVDHAEPLREIRPVFVIGDELHALERFAAFSHSAILALSLAR